MNKTGPKLYLAIDGGTTNTRARLFRGDNFLSAATRTVGVRNVAIGGTTEPLRQAVAECVAEAVNRASIRIEDVGLVCASGMLTSNVGLHDVPHVLAPAGLDDLARHVVAVPFPEIAPQPIHLIPGVKTVPTPATLENLADLDILRGEESESIGLLETTKQTGPLCILLPGSHTKLLHIDEQSRITASYTTIGGELMQAMAERTILASSVDWPPAGSPVWSAVEAGARFAGEWGLARGAFAVRLADVVIGMDRTDRTWWFIGLLVGSDWSELRRWRFSTTGIPLLIGGREPLRSVYGQLAMSAWSGPVEVLDESVVELASARGAIAIAQRFMTQHQDK
jgi:2-dehydro-3-deoxygalactonokinase